MVMLFTVVKTSHTVDVVGCLLGLSFNTDGKRYMSKSISTCSTKCRRIYLNWFAELTSRKFPKRIWLNNLIIVCIIFFCLRFVPINRLYIIIASLFFSLKLQRVIFCSALNCQGPRETLRHESLKSQLRRRLRRISVDLCERFVQSRIFVFCL